MRKVLLGCLILLLCSGVVWASNANIYTETVGVTSERTFAKILFPFESRDLIILNHASSETVFLDLIHPATNSWVTGSSIPLEAGYSLELYGFRTSGVSVRFAFRDASGVTVISVY